MLTRGCALVRLHSLFLILIFLIAGLGSPVLAQAGASLHGTVIQLSGAPVAQANITVEGPGGGQAATTNEVGRYNIKGLKPGTYKFQVSSPGYDLFEVTVTVGDDEDKESDAVLSLTPPAPAAGTGRDEGSRVDAATKQRAPACSGHASDGNSRAKRDVGLDGRRHRPNWRGDCGGHRDCDRCLGNEDRDFQRARSILDFRHSARCLQDKGHVHQLRSL